MPVGCAGPSRSPSKIACCLGATALVAVATGHAQEAEAPVEEPEHRVDFRAGRVEVDGNLQELELAEDVVVVVERYRLTSDRLKLRRSERGIVVEGQGEVALCPCPSAPITLGFDAATVAPPTDLLIENPTLRVGGVPVFWLPYLWLRSPDRVGLLPPRLAWRGEDGLLLGTGVHVPFGPQDASGRRWSWDLGTSGYVKGGGVIESHLATEHTTTLVRWDYLREHLVAASGRGSAARDDGEATAAWRIDVIRGERGRVGTVSLEEAARLWDRAELSVGHFGPVVVGGVGIRADAVRGEELGRWGSAGPRGQVSVAGPLGPVGTAETSLYVVSVEDQDNGAASTFSSQTLVELNVRPGPFACGVAVSERLDLSTTESTQGEASQTEALAGLSLPLVRSYGDGVDPVRHWVEPFLELAGLSAQRRDVPLDSEWPRAGGLLRATAGTTTAIGRYGSRGAGRLTLGGGFVGPAEELAPALSARATARAEAAALRAESYWFPAERDAAVAAVRTRLGPADSVHLEGYLEGSHEVDPLTTRWLGRGLGLAPRAAWFDVDGWTAGTSLAVPWTTWLSSRAGVDRDLSADEWLALHGSLGYRHPCGCLAAVAWAGHRVGRPGVDAWLTLDLIP